MNHGLHLRLLCRAAVPALLAAAILLAVPFLSPATPEYAAQTGQPCHTCHLSEQGGGGLTGSGEAFSEDPSSWRPPAAARYIPPSPSLASRLLRLLLLYVHIFFGVVWVGTILYVHLVLKPRYAIGGLPRSELRLAWLSMPLIAASGMILAWMRLSASPGLLSTRYGTILLFKAGIFLAMVLSATFVTLFVGPRLRRTVDGHGEGPAAEPGGTITADQLEAGDGKEGRASLVAVDGIVYDVSGSRLWRGGRHAGRHSAGRDLTFEIGQAPHGREVLDRFGPTGKLAEGAPQTPMVVKVFIANAYFNLSGCFAIILCLALWRL